MFDRYAHLYRPMSFREYFGIERVEDMEPFVRTLPRAPELSSEA